MCFVFQQIDIHPGLLGQCCMMNLKLSMKVISLNVQCLHKCGVPCENDFLNEYNGQLLG